MTQEEINNSKEKKIVRCEHCAKATPYYLYGGNMRQCTQLNIYVKDDNFCTLGVPREAE